MCLTCMQHRVLKEVSPLAECLARIHFSRQNKWLQLETAGAATSQALLLTLLPSHLQAELSALPLNSVASPPSQSALQHQLAKNTRWDQISLRPPARKAPGRERLGWAGWVMQVQLLGPLSLCSMVTLTGSSVLHAHAAFLALQKMNLKCESWLSRRIESALSQKNPSLFYPFSTVCIILKQREEALNELFLRQHHAQSF